MPFFNEKDLLNHSNYRMNKKLMLNFGSPKGL